MNIMISFALLQTVISTFLSPYNLIRGKYFGFVYIYLSPSELILLYFSNKRIPYQLLILHN
jgi:hypothetical protein